ncbi:uncharacterized protein conserved in bacteria [Hahella chejuensis KCTC 2396]|uniref:Uncharacterized protein conserved in bacteria n=1 Tax=Hahella chejuensis (strain KCTC 2396) TaxID=349521 RepID=Q2SIY0_HAHCH|nr:tetratricopeptide repeat protein [Hahella chejuensis]ABC29394.1 uncharacterized protein conserved in bacteria [Hahella chejuensis KCTC 2396]
MRALTLTAIAVVVSGCSLFSGSEESRRAADQPTIADLKPAIIEDQGEETVNINIDEVIANYTDLLTVVEDPETRTKILYRLADLQMIRNEESSVTQEVVDYSEGSAAYFAVAISAYEGLLKKYPNRAENDQVLYQLAKAYDLEGRRDDSFNALNRLVKEYPRSSYFHEAQFRRGEILFTNGDYDASQRAFESVIRGGAKTGFEQQALYMHGWSLFKQGEYETSLDSFVKVLDLVMPESDDLDALSKESRTLVEDQLRVMGFAFNYLDGVDTVTSLFARVGARSYEHLIYQQYGELLVKEERYTDAVSVYRRFIELHPLSKWSPYYQERVIQTLIVAGFGSSVLPEKAAFVKNYGVTSDFYWRQQDEKVKAFTADKLRVYIDELATHHHAAAQTLDRNVAAGRNGRAKGLDGKEISAQQARTAMRDEYASAAAYYQEFVDTFPQDPKAPQMVFLRGETLFAVQRYEEAIVAYEKAAYEYQGFAKGAEAGYAAITAFDELASGSAEAERAQIELRKIESQIRFAQSYASDPRAGAVMASAAEKLFAMKDYPRAIDVAQRLTQRTPPPDNASLLGAWLIISHSQFELKQYAEAEKSYSRVLALMPANDKRRGEIAELLAASIYKQGELMLAANDVNGAIDQFLRVGQAAPTASVRANADYDAATYMLQQGQWDRAISVLNGFRQRYPQHELAKDVPAKLAMAYRNTEQWDAAAGELAVISQSHPDGETRRESLLLSAELYEKSGQTQKAIDTYRDYANSYPEPADMAAEAGYTLSELYAKANDPIKQRFWLQKVVQGYDAAGSKGSDRMRYLAAKSSSVLADDAFIQFKSIKLTAPLQNSLRSKQEAMKRAMAAYKKTANYRIAEFTTRSSFRLGEIYSQLSRDLLDSERPRNLNELELEQYQLLLEEQAYPFEENAIELHEANAQRSWSGTYDEWVKNSFEALKKLFPARYKKSEEIPEFSENIL